MKKSLLTLTLLLACGVSVAAEEDRDPQALDGMLCAACHGMGGHSISPNFPNLAGQLPSYVEEQLRGFKDKTRSDRDAQDYMWGWAGQLSYGEIKKMSAYFAAQKPSPGEAGDPKLIAEGKRIFESGEPKESVPACASCHGDHAEGRAPAPRLAGQKAPYLEKQLKVFKGEARPAAVVMHAIVQQLTPDQVAALAEYLQSL